ncbi:MAG: BadF/BadG/BcrA/BcrD ATPase family protein [Candidatus Hadarchaeum sp.]|uniref:N-acetylglucosamine kinase n=1 Tax=Candidatus Hadarchaeum sp. TaxID=2883567 RepID=UPI003180CF3C
MIIVGVDGGATATKCIAVDEQGDLIGFGRGGPSNHVHGKKGLYRLKRALSTVFHETFRGKAPQKADSVCLGMTGVRKGTQGARVVETVVRVMLNAAHIYVCDDLEIALFGATLGQSGVLVYSGTGSHTVAMDNSGKMISVGGWGYLIDDEGSGYDIGRQALKWAFRSQDGRGKPTVLVEKLQDHFRCSSLTEVRTKIYENDGLPRPEVAALARLVAEAAAEGDEVAREILAAAGRALAEMAIVAMRRLNKDFLLPVYPAGGVFQAGKWVLDPFVQVLKQTAPNIEVRMPAFPPVVGAIIIAMRIAGIPPTQSFFENLSTRLKEIDWVT